MSTFDAGAIEAKLVLDRSPFTRDLRAAREQARRFEDKPITMQVGADRTKLTKDLKNAREQIRRLTSQKFDVNIGAKFNAKKATEQISRFKAKAANADTNVTVNADAKTRGAALKLDYLKKTANSLDHDKVTINVDADTGKARAQIGLLQGQMLAARGSTSLLIGTIAGLGPATIPIIGATTAAVVGLGGALAAATGGAAVLGAGIIGNFMRAKEMSDLVTNAEKKLREATTPEKRAKAQDELTAARKKVASLPGPIRGAANSILRLKGAWDNFLKAVQGPAFSIINRGLGMMTRFLPKLVPVFNTFISVANSGLTQLSNWFKNSGFLQFFQRQGPSAMSSMIKIALNLGTVVVNLLKAFAPFGNQVLGMLTRMTTGWAKWSQGFAKSSGFQSFLTYAKQNLPLVGQFIGNLVKAVGNLLRALAPFGTMILKTLTGVLGFIGTMDPHLLEGIAVGIIGVVSAFALLNGVMSVFTAISAANPWVLLAVGIVALAAGLVYAWKRSETFRNIVMGALNAVKSAAIAVGNWFTGPFVGFFKSVGAWFSGPFTAPFRAVASWFKGPFVGFFKGIGSWFTGPFLGFFKSVGGWFKGPFVQFFVNIWNGITGAVKRMWQAVQPVINALQAAWRAVGNYFRTVWNGWIYPIIDLFRAVVKRVFGTLFKLYTGYLRAEWRLAGAIVRGVWRNVIKPVIDGFASIIKWLVNSVAKPLWRAMRGAWSGLGSLIRSVYNRVIKPIINFFNAAIRTARNVFSTAVGGIRSAWNTTASFLRSVFRSVMSPVMRWFRDAINLARRVFDGAVRLIRGIWSGLGSFMRSTYNNVIKPIIGFFERRIKDLRGAFRTTVDGIRSIWNELKNIAKQPVKFVIGTVLNNGLIAGFNKLAGVFGTKQMKQIPMPFASGGPIPGWSPTATADNIPIMATADEFMVRQQSARKLAKNEPGALEWINETGTLPPSFGFGGWINNALSTIKGAAGTAVGWGKNLVNAVNPINIMKRTINGLLNKIGGTAFANLIKAGAKSLVGKAWDWASGMFSGGGPGGPAMKGPHIGGGYRWLERMVAAHVRGAIITSDIRPGARTIYGTPSMHSLGRAVDWGGNMRGVWNYLYPMRGRLHELLGPWGMFRDGRVYRDPTLQAMHENHVHASTFARGGFIKPNPKVPVFDLGGIAQPGYNTIYNDLGHPEVLVNKDVYDDHVSEILGEVLKELRKGQGPLVGGNLVLQARPGESVGGQFDNAMFKLRTTRRP